MTAPKPVAPDLISRWEKVVDLGVEMMQQAIGNVVQMAGDRPFGFVRGTALEQIEQYLAIRDDPMAWTALLDEWTLTAGGRRQAEVLAWNEARRLEKMIDDLGGIAAVHDLIVMRHADEGAKAVAEANKLLRQPKADIRPPAPPLDIEGILAPPLPQSPPPVSVTPQQWAGEATYEPLWPPPLPERFDTMVEQ